jgi:hypothetical protein
MMDFIIANKVIINSATMKSVEETSALLLSLLYI